MPSSAPTRICWLCVSGWTQLAVQLILRGHPLNTLEKHAPMWTLGVGGRPLDVALGGEVARFCDDVLSRRRGGAWGDELPFCLWGLVSWALLSDRERCLARGEPVEILRWFKAAVVVNSELCKEIVLQISVVHWCMLRLFYWMKELILKTRIVNITSDPDERLLADRLGVEWGDSEWWLEPRSPLESEIRRVDWSW